MINIVPPQQTGAPPLLLLDCPKTEIENRKTAQKTKQILFNIEIFLAE
jgi:hypothetical protein